MKACLPSNQCTVPENTKLLQDQRNNLESKEENVNNIPPSQIRSARSSLHADDVVLIRNVPRESSTNNDETPK